MHRSQAVVNEALGEAEGLTPFGLGIGVTTGRAAAALLGSEERLEYTLVGDTVNLAARLQQWAEPGETDPGRRHLPGAGRPAGRRGARAGAREGPGDPRRRLAGPAARDVPADVNQYTADVNQHKENT